MRTLLAFLVLACSTDPIGPVPPPPPPPPPPPAGALRIVILGNSLTYSNSMPTMIADLAVASGKPRPTVVAHAHGNFALMDHWENAASTAAMDDATVDVLILQQGPSTLESSGANLRQYATMIADRAARSNTRMGMYVAWPPVGGKIDDGIMHYTQAADARSMAIYPVGHAFRHMLVNHPQVPIRESDAFHPNSSGSWLAALIICAVIYDLDPTGMPNPSPGQIPVQHETVLRNTAKLMVDTYGRR